MGDFLAVDREISVPVFFRHTVQAEDALANGVERPIAIWSPAVSSKEGGRSSTVDASASTCCSSYEITSLEAFGRNVFEDF